MADGEDTMMHEVHCRACGNSRMISTSALAEWNLDPLCPLCTGEASSDEEELVAAVLRRERRMAAAAEVERMALETDDAAAPMTQEGIASRVREVEREVAYRQLTRDIEEQARRNARIDDANRWIRGLRQLLDEEPSLGALRLRERLEEYVLRRLYWGLSSTRTRPTSSVEATASGQASASGPRDPAVEGG